jgi:bifunctional enzyme CysN/CysC
MITGASTADCAVVLIDARKGVLTQTRRHSYLVSLIGIRHIVLAVNKMDLVDWSQERFEQIERDYRAFATEIGIHDVTCIPLSGLSGANVVDPSPDLAWYSGPTLMQYLEAVELDEERMQLAPFRMPVQWVNRPNLDFRGFSGTIAGGTIAPGDRIVALPSGQTSEVARIVTFDGDLGQAVAGQSITLTLTDEIDISRGDVIAKADARPAVADQFEATIIWMADEPMLPGRNYLLRIADAQATATITPLKYKVNINSLERLAATKLELNEIGVVDIELDRAIAFDPYKESRETGGFILIDRITSNTVGAGLLHFALRRSDNVHWQAVDVDKHSRAALSHQRPCIVWLTGLSGSGKSTIANLVEQKLHAIGRHTYLLDGDNVRHGLNKDLGFTDADRVENVRRVGEVAKLMVDAGLIVLCSFISPFRTERRTVRALVEQGEFLEVYVDTPLEIAEQRDVKGLYAKARRGELKNFTGVDSPYEPPENPELRVDTSRLTPEQAADQIIAALERGGTLTP